MSPTAAVTGVVPQRVLTAYHEAGHALAAWYFGLQIQSVSIKPNSEEGTLGTCFRKSAGPGSEEKDIIVMLAGHEAERLVVGKRIGATDDRRRAEELMQLFGLRPGDLGVHLKSFQLRSRRLVETFSPLAEALAAALLEQETLSGEEAERIIAEQIAPYAGPPHKAEGR